MPSASCLCRAGCAASLVLSGKLCQAETDPYPQLLAEEVTKVEESPDEVVKVQEDATRLVAQSARSAAPRKRFEELWKQHIGTYGSYSRLTERQRKEIFVDCGNGVLIDARTESWFCKGTIPGSVNHPFTLFGKDREDPVLVAL